MRAGERSPALSFTPAPAYLSGMTRHARCQCGALKVAAEGAQEAVVLCSCRACQRKSGSAFALGVYFRREQLSIEGQASSYVRIADSGVPFHEFFCPKCATTLYWHSDRDPARVGLAAGALEDHDGLRPDRSVFDENKHDWLVLPGDMPGFTRGRDSPRSR
jgi:hypothetical protein